VEVQTLQAADLEVRRRQGEARSWETSDWWPSSAAPQYTWGGTIPVCLSVIPAGPCAARRELRSPRVLLPPEIRPAAS